MSTCNMPITQYSGSPQTFTLHCYWEGGHLKDGLTIDGPPNKSVGHDEILDFTTLLKTFKGSKLWGRTCICTCIINCVFIYIYIHNLYNLDKYVPFNIIIHITISTLPRFLSSKNHGLLKPLGRFRLHLPGKFRNSMESMGTCCNENPQLIYT